MSTTKQKPVTGPKKRAAQKGRMRIMTVWVESSLQREFDTIVYLFIRRSSMMVVVVMVLVMVMVVMIVVIKVVVVAVLAIMVL